LRKTHVKIAFIAILFGVLGVSQARADVSTTMIGDMEVDTVGLHVNIDSPNGLNLFWASDSSSLVIDGLRIDGGGQWALDASYLGFLDMSDPTYQTVGDCGSGYWPCTSGSPAPYIQGGFYDGSYHFGPVWGLCPSMDQYTSDLTFETGCGGESTSTPFFGYSTSTASTTAELIGTVQLGTGIIIVILFIYLSAYLYNSFFKKKPLWQR